MSKTTDSHQTAEYSVKVTLAQVAAAKLRLEIAQESGETIDPAVEAIANAVVVPSEPVASWPKMASEDIAAMSDAVGKFGKLMAEADKRLKGMGREGGRESEPAASGD